MTPITRIKRKYNAALLNLFNPSRGCSSILLHPPRVSPAVIDIQALRACTNNSEFFCLTCRAATKSCPYLPSCPDPFNREYQTLHGTSLLSPLSTLSSSLLILHSSQVPQSPSPIVLQSSSQPSLPSLPRPPLPVNIPQCFDKNPLK